MSKYFGFTSLTGGGTGALDAINGAVITVGDIAVGVSSAESFVYVCDGSGDAESSPDVIAPDTSPGAKRWKRVHDEDKAYRAAAPTNGNLAEVDADGDVVDSGIASAIIDDLGTITGYAGKVPVVNSAEDGYDLVALPNRNLLINGCFRVAQRGVSFTSATTPANSDDTYLLDRWTLLSDGNDIVDVTQSTERPATKFLKSIALDVETTNKKFGIVQFIENQNAEYIIGDTVVFSFYAKVSSATKLDNVKAAIISWGSTADSVTSDVVSAWGNENVNPTLAANWTYENTPANLNVTTSWARYSVSAAIDTASTTNVGVMIWSDVTDTTAGDFLYITGCQLELGSSPSAFEYRPISVERQLCKRYYQTFGGVNGDLFYDGYAADANAYITQTVSLPVDMRVVVSPSVGGTWASTNTGTIQSQMFTTNVFTLLFRAVAAGRLFGNCDSADDIVILSAEL